MIFENSEPRFFRFHYDTQEPFLKTVVFENSEPRFFRFHYDTQELFLKTVVFENNLTTVKFRLDETKRQYNYLS